MKKIENPFNSIKNKINAKETYGKMIERRSLIFVFLLNNSHLQNSYWNKFQSGIPMSSWTTTKKGGKKNEKKTNYEELQTSKYWEEKHHFRLFNLKCMYISRPQPLHNELNSKSLHIHILITFHHSSTWKG